MCNDKISKRSRLFQFRYGVFPILPNASPSSDSVPVKSFDSVVCEFLRLTKCLQTSHQATGHFSTSAVHSVLPRRQALEHYTVLRRASSPLIRRVKPSIFPMMFLPNTISKTRPERVKAMGITMPSSIRTQTLSTKS